MEMDFVLSGFRAVSNWAVKKYSIGNFYDICLELYLKGFRGRIFNEALVIIGIELNEEVINEMVRVYRLHRPSLELLSDAKEIIIHLFIL